MRIIKKTLAENRPDLVKGWDYDNNPGLSPETITLGSGKYVNWICSKGHSFSARIPDRIRGDGCPYCSGRKLLIGFNDLATTHPDIAKEWDYKKNDPVTPKDVSYGMNKEKYGWICSKCGHKWDAAPLTRTRGSWCPECGKKIQKKARIKRMLKNGENSLEYVRPDLVKEWHPTRNGDKKPSDYTPNSSERIIWLCSKCGNEWPDSINHRNNGRGCPECNERSTSLSEQSVYFYIKKYIPSAINRDKSNGFELDIYIPKNKIAIEYDGHFFHGNNKSGMSDDKKDKLCLDKGIKLIRIREKGLKKTKQATNIIRESNSDKDLERCVVDLYNLLNIKDFDKPNIKKDITEINNLYTETFKKNSLSALYPKVAERWHPTKNGKLKPDRVSAHSGRYVWWLCPNNHDYYQAISAATAGHGCDKCARKDVGKKLQKKNLIIGKNDLASLYPKIAGEWDYEKNSDRPQDYLSHSNIKKYWICPICGESYKAQINNRTQGKGHKKCSMKLLGLKRSKSVKCVETGTVFSTLEEAAEWAKVTKSAISCCARGKTKTCGGFCWEYVDLK